MKKLLLVILFLLSSLSALAVRYVVDTKDGYANLREEASSKSKVLKKLKNKDEVKLWGNKGEWLYVIYELEDGSDIIFAFIHKSQVKLHPETYEISTKEGYANVRNEATKNSSIIRKLKNGEVVTRFKEYQKGNWYYIEFVSDGVPFNYGYIHKCQLKNMRSQSIVIILQK